MKENAITAAAVLERVEKIRAKSLDAECAHFMEDVLHVDVLRSISLCSSDPWARGLADAALTTSNINFQRTTPDVRTRAGRRWWSE